MKEKLPIIGIIGILLFSVMSVPAMGSLPVVELPPTTEDIRMIATDGINSWFDMNISGIPSGYDIANGTYLGWCVQKDTSMRRDVNHAVLLYSSYDPAMPESFLNTNWDKVNYVINHKLGGRETIQAVIWYFICNGSYPSNDTKAKAMITDANNSQASNGSFVPQPGQKIVILVDVGKIEYPIQRAFFEFTLPFPVEPGTPIPRVVSNHLPTADATAGEPYGGLAHAEITFDGSRSYDRDGRIISWRWNFGDGTNGTGEVVKHIYDSLGNYTVILKVTDNKFATDYYTTTAVITLGNNPPTTPVVSGPSSGHKNISFIYTAVSTDPDGDAIQYVFDWGDNTNTTKGFFQSGANCTVNHTWTAAGFYTMRIYAQDPSNASSEVYEMVVSIDVHYVGDIGYLIDGNSDGIFDVFHSNVTGIETGVGMQGNGEYLIDTDADGLWNMIYDPASGQLQVYQAEEPVFAYAVLVILVISFALIFYFISKRKRSNKHK